MSYLEVNASALLRYTLKPFDARVDQLSTDQLLDCFNDLLQQSQNGSDCDSFLT